MNPIPVEILDLVFKEQGKKRTLVYEDELHVGTIVYQADNQYQWITRSTMGHAESYDEALKCIETELQR